MKLATRPRLVLRFMNAPIPPLPHTPLWCAQEQIFLIRNLYNPFRITKNSCVSVSVSDLITLQSQQRTEYPKPPVINVPAVFGTTSGAAACTWRCIRQLTSTATFSSSDRQNCGHFSREQRKYNSTAL